MIMSQRIPSTRRKHFANAMQPLLSKIKLVVGQLLQYADQSVGFMQRKRERRVSDKIVSFVPSYFGYFRHFLSFVPSCFGYFRHFAVIEDTLQAFVALSLHKKIILHPCLSQFDTFDI